MALARNALRDTDPEGLASNSRIFVFAGDGCLQEGITSEASSLAGTKKLDRLIVLYDDNNITIDGKTSISFAEDAMARYKAYGWFIESVDNGDTDLQGIYEAIERALKNDGPTIIRVKTTIGYGLKNEGTSSVHGSPPDAESIKMLRTKFGLEKQEAFSIT